MVILVNYSAGFRDGFRAGYMEAQRDQRNEVLGIMTAEDYPPTYIDRLRMDISPEPTTKSKRRRKDPKMKKALREANARLRNKNGSLKKGKTQADIMKLAHRLKKKM